MKLISLAALLTGPALAFRVPQGQPDGVYSVHLDANGTEFHQWLADPSAPLPNTPPSISKRTPQLSESYLVNCWGRNLDHEATDAANADLDRQCSTGVLVSRGNSIYAKRGGVVAFACNRRADYTVRCEGWVRSMCSERITGRCGRYVSGECWADPQAWGPGNSNYGYAEENAGFCQRKVLPSGMVWSREKYGCMSNNHHNGNESNIHAHCRSREKVFASRKVHNSLTTLFILHYYP